MAALAKRAAFVTQLVLRNVKSFLGDQTLDLTDENGAPARWTLILGDNGVGKTTLLECLAHLAPVFGYNTESPYNPEDPLKYIEPRVESAENLVIESLGRNGDIDFKIEATFTVDSELESPLPAPDTVVTSLTFSRVGEKSDNIVAASNWSKDKQIVESTWPQHSKFRQPLVLAYGAGRHMGLENLDFSDPPEPTDSLLKGTVPLVDADQLLQRLDYSAKSSPEAARQRDMLIEMIAALLPEVEQAANIHVYPPPALGSKGKRGVYVRTSDGEVPLRQLSFGYQTMTAWLADIGWWLFRHYPESDRPLDEPAIVLVDEIDLHLHPRWQRQIRERLTLHFPNIQFIATAHSPLMAQAFLDANLAVVTRDGDHSIIENDPVVVANWRVDQIITSDLYDLPAWPPQVDALFEEQRRLLGSPERSPADATRLKEIEAELLELPTERSSEDERAMTIIKEAAALLKSSARRA